ncbi:MAG: ABC transporter permease [Chloroflexaceae bacterium]|nr:ABC transporter permease [Chloroflexaceae bacterium]
MVSIARKNLLEDLPRFLVAQAGIMFAVGLVAIQTGILNGFTRSTVRLIEDSEADLWVASEKIVHFELTEPLLTSQLEEAEQIPGVAVAEALLLGVGRWQTPQGQPDPLKIVGFDPQGQLFQPGYISEGTVNSLLQPYQVMVDRTRLTSLQAEGIGVNGTVNQLPARIAAITEDSQSIPASAFVFTSLDNANTYLTSSLSTKVNCQLQENDNLRCTKVYENSGAAAEVNPGTAPAILPLSQTDAITYILVKAQPQQDLTALKQKLEAALNETRVLTTAELSQITRQFWQTKTGVGWILGLGAAVGVVVGMVVVTQILYASVSDHLKEFGTLKAMGASNGLLYRIVMEQALWMAVLGYVPGMLLCVSISVFAAGQGIVILITPLTAAAALGLVVVMCLGSGALAIGKVIRLDPASVFKA